MERRSQTTQVGVRIPNGLLKKIDEDIDKNGDYASRADYIVASLRQFLEYRTKILIERKKAFEDEEINQDKKPDWKIK